MSTPVEMNLQYSFPQEVCYEVLREKVIPNVKLKIKSEYIGIKFPNGGIGLREIEAHWRANMLVVKIRNWGLVDIGLTMGPPINIYCRSTGPDTTLVEVVADAGSFYDGFFLNFLLDVVYKKIPGYSALSRMIFPNMYFDDTLVIDKTTLKNKSFNDDMGRKGLTCIFKKIHELLAVELNNSPDMAL